MHLSLLPPPHAPVNQEQILARPGIFARVIFHDSIPAGHVGVPDWLRRNLGPLASPICQVALTLEPGVALPADTSLTIHPAPGLTDEQAREMFQAWVKSGVSEVLATLPPATLACAQSTA